ncbi:uncharacterized protein V6R79_013164 [Siganus canaliculatus]
MVSPVRIQCRRRVFQPALKSQLQFSFRFLLGLGSCARGTMTSKSNIPLKGPSVNIVRQCGHCLSDILQSKFGCTATIEGLEFEDPIAAHQTRLTVSHEKRFEGTLPTGVRVSVWKADLTEFSADAVVNVANEALQHIGGLALALSTAGGPQIQTESDDHINVYGNVKTGDAIVTTAGKLKCKKIIHAVGPQLPFNPHRYDVDQAEPLLKRTIFSILDRVEENQLETVAIPAISSGIFNYPLPQCADTIVKAVINYYELFPRYPPKEILLVNNDEPTVKEMERACHMILSHRQQQPTSYSGAAASNSRDGGKTSAPSVQMGSVRLTLMKGKIEEQTTDVIVNATFNKQWNSQISAALLKKAGEGIREELYAAPMFGSITVTGAYKLQCRQVYHIFYPQTAVTEREAQQSLSLSVTHCLQAAAKHHHKSISFPAIGTGNMGLSKKDIAQLMTQAVAEFAQMWKEKMDVCFVIFPSDKDTFKVFEQQFKNLQPKTSESWEKSKEYNPKSEHSENFHRTRAPPPPPHISVSGPSDAAVCEATRWLAGLLLESTGPVLIRNNFISHLSKEERCQLTRLPGVSIKEEFEKSRASITVAGREHEAVAVAALQVEAMLCTIQKEFITEQESDMFRFTTQTVSVQREKMDQFGPLFADKKALFDHTGMRIVKVDEVKNATLQMLFDRKKKQLKISKTQKMYQRIPAQFIELISHVGFHTECAPPDDPAYGQGIYFTNTVRRAMEVWKVSDEEYVHFVEAEVLVGESTRDRPEFILPPALTSDPHQNYDSVSGPGIAVIFSSYQALPKCIITCKRLI